VQLIVHQDSTPQEPLVLNVLLVVNYVLILQLVQVAIQIISHFQMASAPVLTINVTIKTLIVYHVVARNTIAQHYYDVLIVQLIAVLVQTKRIVIPVHHLIL